MHEKRRFTEGVISISLYSGFLRTKSLKMSDRNELMRMILEIDQLKTKLEANLQDAGEYYDELKKAYKAAVNRLTLIEPKLDKSKKDADFCHVAGNGSSVFGGILATLSYLPTPLIAAASGLTAAGMGFFGMGGVVTVGATVKNSIVKNMNYSEAKELLDTFQRYKTQLCQELDKVYEVSKRINEKREIDKYMTIFEIMFPENSVHYKVANAYYKNPDFLTRFDVLRGLDGAANFGKGVYLFVKVLEELSTQGAKVTKGAIAKVLLPVGVVIDTGFLISSIHELSTNKKCDVAKMIGLMKETIQKEMEDIDEIRSKLCYFHLVENT